MKMYVKVAAFAVLATVAATAATVPVPNASFEGPVTPFADPRIDSWQDNPKPSWYDEVTNGPWDFLTGVFVNTEPGSSNYIHNIHGTQASFLFAVPQAGIFQDYNSVDWAHPAPTHEFNATYQPGKAYQLKVGVIGGGGGMSNNATLGIALYYRDASSNMVFVAMTNVVHSTNVFPTTTNFVDIPTGTSVVKASDAWANQNIGIAIFSTVGFELMGGYWDLDNVRLLEIQPTLPVPNASFEGPATPFADPRIDSWQDNPKPPWYDEVTNGPWDFLTGVFVNTEPGSSNYIHNIHGTQASFLFAVPQAGIFQDYNSIDWAHPAPTHEFNAIYQAGKAYQLTVGVIGGGGGMSNNASLGIGLYYRDASSNMVFVAMTNVAHSTNVFPTTTNFVDIPTITSVVKASDAWANQNIGIAIFSTVGFELMGGYWDLDNVRLREIQPPRLRTSRAGEIVIEGEAGSNFDILAATSLGTPVANWTRIGTVSNATGTVTFTDPSTSTSPRFYTARLIP